jgi:hypothetical protein
MATAARSVTAALALAHRASAARSRQRLKIRNFEHALVRKSGVGLSAIALGVMARKGVGNDIGGFPWKPLVWAAATLTEAFSGSAVLSQIAGGVADTTMAVYVKDAVQSGDFVAGDELA